MLSQTGINAYHLVDVGDFRLENGDSVSDGGFFVEVRSGFEGGCSQESKVWLVSDSGNELGQHC
jgi:hypothetical protein